MATDLFSGNSVDRRIGIATVELEPIFSGRTAATTLLALYYAALAFIYCYDWRPPVAFSFNRFYWPTLHLMQFELLAVFPFVAFLVLRGWRSARRG